MSKVGKQPIEIPEEIDIDIGKDEITVSNGSDKMVVDRLEGVEVEKKEEKVHFSIDRNTKQVRSNWGTLRSLVENAVEGLSDGFEKSLVLKGVGYRIKDKGNVLELDLGFSEPVKYEKPEGLTFEIEDKNKLTIKGQDKQLVGQAAAEIRDLRPVEPYKGKGFRYEGEEVRRKVGKKGVGEGMGEGAA